MHTHTHKFLNTHSYWYVYTCAHTHTHTYTHIYTHTHTHTHIHIYTHTTSQPTCDGLMRGKKKCVVKVMADGDKFRLLNFSFFCSGWKALSVRP